MPIAWFATACDARAPCVACRPATAPDTRHQRLAPQRVSTGARCGQPAATSAGGGHTDQGKRLLNNLAHLAT
jgi:hypothetical protein